MQVGLSMEHRKKVFTIIPEIRLLTTPAEQNQSKEEQRVNVINTINDMMRSSCRPGSYIIEKVFLDGELVDVEYVCIVL